MLWMDSRNITFTPESPSLTNVTWEPANNFNVTENGLGWEDEPAAHRDITLRFKPIPIGYSWRAPAGVGVSMKVFSDRSEYILNSGHTSTPYPGQFYVRYSVNRKNWSSWINVPQDNTTDAKYWYYHVGLGVPDLNMIEYREYYNAYKQLDVPWVDDQNALAEWIVKEDPAFFANHIPFIGWIEILYEGSIGGSRRFNEINISLGIGISGMHSSPKDAYTPDYRSPWNFYQE